MDIGQKIARDTLREALLRIAAVPWYRMREQTVRVIIEKKKKTKAKRRFAILSTFYFGGSDSVVDYKCLTPGLQKDLASKIKNKLR